MLKSCPIVLALCVACVLVASPLAWAGKTHEIKMTPYGVFHVAETDRWKVRVERYMPIRLADVRVENKQGYPFSLMLYFKCDTPDPARYDSPEKMERSVLISSKKYLPVTV